MNRWNRRSHNHWSPCCSRNCSWLWYCWFPNCLLHKSSNGILSFLQNCYFSSWCSIDTGGSSSFLQCCWWTDYSQYSDKTCWLLWWLQFLNHLHINA